VEFSWPIGMPLCRALGQGLWEVRSVLPQGRIARPRPRRLGRASRQRCVQVHAPVRGDGDPQRARVLEPRAPRHRARARRRRSVARAGRGCLVADLSVGRGDVRRHGWCAAEPQRHRHLAGSGRHQLARGSAAAGDRGSATGEGLGPGPCGHRGALRGAHHRLRRHAARIPERQGTAMTMPRRRPPSLRGASATKQSRNCTDAWIASLRSQ
jgi:hypothetical protein